MAISIDYSTFVINVPRADMLLVQSMPYEIRELDLDDFRQELNDLMDDMEGIPYPTNHVHTASASLGGVVFARQVEILSPYTVTFEDGLYGVDITGGNSNIRDVVNRNQVSVNTANSAGLIDASAIKQVVDDILTRQGGIR